MILDLEDLPFEQKEKIQLFQKLLGMNQGTSEALAAHVVLYKSMGLFRESAVCCMAELQRRRVLGEEFDFESFIENELKKLPKVQPLDFGLIRGLMSMQQISSFLSPKDQK